MLKESYWKDKPPKFWNVLLNIFGKAETNINKLQLLNLRIKIIGA